MLLLLFRDIAQLFDLVLDPIQVMNHAGVHVRRFPCASNAKTNDSMLGVAFILFEQVGSARISLRKLLQPSSKTFPPNEMSHNFHPSVFKIEILMSLLGKNLCRLFESRRIFESKKCAVLLYLHKVRKFKKTNILRY